MLEAREISERAKVRTKTAEKNNFFERTTE
ncbi:MAG: hypothetical protein ACD_79C00355G0001, partial [uncultured bacterium]